MTFVSKLALAAVLTLGTSALGAAPAVAQKKEQNGAPELKLGADFRKVAAPADAAVRAKDWATAEPAIVASEAAAKNDDEKYFAGQLRLQLEAARNNEAGVLAAMTTLAANPKTPPENAKVMNTQVALLNGYAASKAKKHAEAIQYLTKARDLGSTEPDLPVTLANSYAATGKDAEAVAEVDRAIKASKAAGRKAPQDWYRFAIPRVNKLGDRTVMADWLTRYIQDYPTAQNWRWAIQVFAQGAAPGANEKVERIDLFRLMRATNVLADKADYSNYAYAVQQAGLPWEAVAVIDEGRKAGKIPSGDSDTTQTYTASQAGVKAEGSLETVAKGAKTAKAAQQTGDAFLASGNYARAVALYDQALSGGAANADEINLHRGIALQRQGRKEEARTAFLQVKGGYANLALLWQASLDMPPLS